MKKELSITDVFDVLWEKKILFLIILIIFFLVGILSYYLVPKKYLLVNKLYHIDIVDNTHLLNLHNMKWFQGIAFNQSFYQVYGDKDYLGPVYFSNDHRDTSNKVHNLSHYIHETLMTEDIEESIHDKRTYDLFLEQSSNKKIANYIYENIVANSGTKYGIVITITIYPVNAKELEDYLHHYDLLIRTVYNIIRHDLKNAFLQKYEYHENLLIKDLQQISLLINNKTNINKKFISMKSFKESDQHLKNYLQNLYDSVNETYYHKENKELIDHYISNIDSINLFSYDHKNLSVNLLSKNLMFYIIYSMLLVLIFICILISSIFAYRFRN